MSTQQSLITADELFPLLMREMYLAAGRTAPSKGDVNAIIAEARRATEPPLTFRKLVPFIRRWLRPWEEVHVIIEEAAA